MYENLPQAYQGLAEDWGDKGGTVGFLGVEGEGIIGAFSMTDMIRDEAKETIETLMMRGIKVLMLTGDGEGAAKAVGRQVGLGESSIHYQLVPEDKLHYVAGIKQTAPSNSFGLFRRQPKILFCGDGVNDAPALAVADVGVSMGEGAALAMEMSDVTLMDSNLSKLVYVIEMGTRVMFTVQENIILSLACKLVVVALTFGGYMTLLYAIASDVGVMLLVTLNGMKLLPGETGDALGERSRRQGLNKYDQIPLAGTVSPTGVAEIKGEIV
jgi:Cd2+/Zn2+-exporting ATPase